MSAGPYVGYIELKVHLDPEDETKYGISAETNFSDTETVKKILRDTLKNLEVTEPEVHHETLTVETYTVDN
jgi:hypothetical protein